MRYEFTLSEMLDRMCALRPWVAHISVPKATGEELTISRMRFPRRVLGPPTMGAVEPGTEQPPIVLRPTPQVVRVYSAGSIGPVEWLTEAALAIVASMPPIDDAENLKGMYWGVHSLPPAFVVDTDEATVSGAWCFVDASAEVARPVDKDLDGMGFGQIQAELVKLRAAVRAHRAAMLLDRLWRDDVSLYGALPEGAPAVATAVPVARGVGKQRSPPGDDIDAMSEKTAKAEVRRLRVAIRDHRGQRGDDRCWLDDMALYAMLPDGPPDPSITALPPEGEFLANCARYHARRQAPSIGPADGPQGRWVTRAEVDRFDHGMRQIERFEQLLGVNTDATPPARLVSRIFGHLAALNDQVTSLQERLTAEETARRGALPARVRDTFRRSGFPVLDRPTMRPDDRVRKRARRMADEFFEVLETMFDAAKCTVDYAPRDVQVAVGYIHRLIEKADVRVDLPDLAHELVDLASTCEGTAAEFGIDLAPIVTIVHDSLVRRLELGGEKGADGRIAKPPGWVSPREAIAATLRAQGWEG